MAFLNCEDVPMTQASKGIFGHLSTAGRAPRPGTMPFKLWTRITAFNTVVYRATRGRIGGSMDGAPVVLVHHVGRKSGEERVAPLLYLPDGDDVVIVASYGGAPKNPAWYHNLTANPDTQIELKGRKISVRAETVNEAERAELWPRIVAMYPAFAEYAARTERVIPVVRLRPVS